MAQMTMSTRMNTQRAREFFEDKVAFTAGPVEVNRMLEEHEPVIMVDVRAPEDYAEGHVPGAINLSKESWQDMSRLSKDRINVLYCYSHVCHLAAKAAFTFSEKGYPVLEMEGGMKSWREHEMPVESGQR